MRTETDMEIIEKYFFLLFAAGTLAFYVSIYRTYKYAQSKGYKPIFPLGEMRGLSKFISQCSKIQKETKDKELRNHILAMNICFGLVFVLIMSSILI